MATFNTCFTCKHRLFANTKQPGVSCFRCPLHFSLYSLCSWGSMIPLSTLVPLSGTLTLTAGSPLAVTSADLRSEIFRNDVIIIVGPSGSVGASGSGSDASSNSSGSNGASSSEPSGPPVAKSFRVHSGALRGNLKTLLARVRKEALERELREEEKRRIAAEAGFDSYSNDDEKSNDDNAAGEGTLSASNQSASTGNTSAAAGASNSGNDRDKDDYLSDISDDEGEDDAEGFDDEGTSSSAAAATAPSSSSNGTSAASAGGQPPPVKRGRGRPPKSSILNPQQVQPQAASAGQSGPGRPSADAAKKQKDNKPTDREKDASAAAAAAAALFDRANASVLAEHGILTVSVGNAVMNSGGHFSASDTAPHVLRSTALGYAHAFSATSLPLDRPWDGPSGSGFRAFKYGLSGDLRVLWHETVVPGALAKLAAHAHGGASATAAASSSSSAAGGKGEEDGTDGQQQQQQQTQAASAAAAAASLITPDQTSFGGPDALLNILASHIAFGGSGGGGGPPAAGGAGAGGAGAAGSGGGGGGGLHSRSFPVDHRELRAEMAKLGLDRISPMEPGTLTSGPAVPTVSIGGKNAKGKRRRPDKRAFSFQSNLHVFEAGENSAVALSLKRARLEVLREEYESKKK